MAHGRASGSVPLTEAEENLRFEQAYRILDRRLDLPSMLLNELLLLCEGQNGVISDDVRARFNDRVPLEYFDEIEKVVSDAFGMSRPGRLGGDPPNPDPA